MRKINIEFTKKQTLSILFVALVIAAGLRFWNITSMGIWYWDEAYYANLAKAPVYIFDYIFDSAENGSVREYLMNRGVTGTPFLKPGHIFFLTISFFVLGVNDYAPVFMMGIFGIALVYLVYRFGEEFLSKEAGLFSALIMAVSGHMIFYSRSAFPQMDTVFFGLLGAYFYLKYSKNSGKRKFLWYSGASFAVGMLMHQSLAIPILILLLIEAASTVREKKEIKLMWVHVSASTVEDSAIWKFQAAHTPPDPLDALAKPRRAVLLAEIAKNIRLAVYD